MENATYTTLNRQSGLLREMRTVAQNIANISTNGYRKEGVVFSEFVVDTGPDAASLSMANVAARRTDFSQGNLTMTGGAFDFAIEGPGYFLLATPEGDRLTRAGSFTPSPDGVLVAPDGAQLLDAGGAPIFLPPDAANVGLGADGTLTVDGNPVAQVGLWEPDDALAMRRAEGVRFDPGGPPVPAVETRVLQGFLEDSNVDAVGQLSRMIEVQRAYELGQTFLDREDERVRSTIRAVGQ
jgi:flagellar basal-body rod protein FlgF